MTMPQTTHNLGLIRWLTFLMFTMFAMTTDAVGVIIPEIIKEFNLSLTQASAFHYATMVCTFCSASVRTTEFELANKSSIIA